MKRFILFLALATTFVNPIFAASADVIISVEDQQKRDSDKLKILNAEIENENNAIIEKEHLLTIAESMKDTQAALALRSEIEQHGENIQLLKQELGQKTGGKTKEEGKKKTQESPVSDPESVETQNADWWNPYNRKATIKLH